MVCTTTIYGFTQEDRASNGDLYKHLRHKKPYKKPQAHQTLEAKL
jgi:hypothetical protein